MHRPFLRPLPLVVVAFLASLTLAQQPVLDEKAKATLDRRILEDAKKGSEILKNLTYLSDQIGPRLTGSANLKKAGEWGAARMKEYGLVNVHLEPWTIPEGWQRGHAHARLIGPDTGRTLSIASMGWSPGTNGKVEADVVILKASTIEELNAYKGKLKGAVVLSGPPVKLKSLEETIKPDGPPTSAAEFGGKQKSLSRKCAPFRQPGPTFFPRKAPLPSSRTPANTSACSSRPVAGEARTGPAPPTGFRPHRSPTTITKCSGGSPADRSRPAPASRSTSTTSSFPARSS